RINDVERDDEDEASPGVEEECSRLPVDLRQPPGQAQREHPPAETEQQSGHVLAAMDRMRERQCSASPITVGDCVCGQQADEPLGVALLGRGEEPPSELLAPAARCLEARLSRLDLPAGAHGELTAVVLVLAQDVRDLPIVVAEHLAKQEDRS